MHRFTYTKSHKNTELETIICTQKTCKVLKKSCMLHVFPISLVSNALSEVIRSVPFFLVLGSVIILMSFKTHYAKMSYWYLRKWLKNEDYSPFYALGS